ncbi:MAG: Ryanodine receptor Ryr [Muribaculaceae bacterium]|nr:Ryanodine receptor Ryr [Muribaculaceae bacterium]
MALPTDLMDLAEDLARNVHDVWAAARIAEGWTYGPVRDDANRRTPCLVPYDELPQSERDYDRRTSQETLRYIISRGFKIEKNE